MSSHPAYREVRENLYGLRSARELAAACESFGNPGEANRHRKRARLYAETIRNIIRERTGADAYLNARRELSA